MSIIQFIDIITFAFINAKCNKGSISLRKLTDKYNNIEAKNLMACMDEAITRAIFKREITGNGIIYRLTGKFRYADFDTVNNFVKSHLRGN